MVDVNSPPDAWAAGILLHPHPDWGGNRFNPAIDALYRALPAIGVGAARFDFSSSDTVVAADQTLQVINLIPTRPLVLVGYSFGADIAATLTDDRLAGWFLVAPPFGPDGGEHRNVAVDPRPKALALPELDQFFPPADVAKATEGWVNTAVNCLPGADHFLAGSVERVVDQVVAWLRSPALTG